MVVVPTPPLGLNTVMTRRALGSPIDAVASGTTGAAPVDRSNRSDTASTRASSSTGSNGFVITSSAPASSSAIRSSMSSAWAIARTGSLDVASSRRSSSITALTVYGSLTRSTMTRE